MLAFRRRGRRERSGFTLVEVLLVLAIIGILLGVGMPSFQRYIQTARFQQSVRVFVDALIIARDTATRESTPVSVEAAGSVVRWYYVGDSTPISTSSIPFGTTLLGGPVEVLISGRGMPQTQVTFSLVSGDYSSSVFLLPTGAVLR